MPSSKCQRFFRAAAICAAVLAALPAAATAQSYHRVGAGETLDAIARRYRVSVYDIAKANKLSPNTRPTVGTRLYVPGTAKAPAASSPSRPAAARPATTAPKPTAAPAAASPAPSKAATPSSAGGTIVVPAGGSLWGLAKKHGVSVEDLAAANGIKSTAGLTAGQVLRLPGSSAAPPAAAPAAKSSDPPPPSKTSSSSSSKSPVALASSSGRVSTKGFMWPVEGRVLKSFADSFREKHAGMDIAAPVGTPVRAVQGGTVVWAGKITTYGRMVIVQHTGGLASCYAYNSEILVRENQTVKRGDVIARSGDPGKGGQPFLHFQLRKNGDAIDPKPWLP